MKKLIIGATVALAAGAYAATNTVTSANIVGYNKETALVGIQMRGVPFNVGTTNTPTTVYGTTLPANSKIWTYDPVDGYDQAIFSVSIFGSSWDKDLDLGGSAGYWLDIPDTAPASITNIISGEVPLDDSYAVNVVAGLQMLSFPYPVAKTVGTLGITPSNGDTVWVYYPETASYDQAIYSVSIFGSSWDKPNLAIEIGQAFWLDSNTEYTWNIARPFNLD